MSVVIGLKHEDEVWVASDGRFIDTSNNIIQVGEYDKVIKNGKYLLGYVGEVRTAQLMVSRYFTPPEDIFNFPQSIIKMLRTHGALIVSDTEVKNSACDFLIAYDDKLFELDSDFSLVEIEKYVAIGSGDSQALSSLRTTEGMTMEIEERIRLALQVTCSFVTCCQPPFFVKTTKGKNFRWDS